MFELTALGYLTLSTFLFGLLTGAQPVASGFSASASVPYGGGSAEVRLTPWAAFQYDSPALYGVRGMGVTLGGTTLMVSANAGASEKRFAAAGGGAYKHYRPWAAMRDELNLRYEWAHLKGWEHFGLAYAAKAFGECQTYDPNAAWCPSNPDFEDSAGRWNMAMFTRREADLRALAPATGAVVLRFGW